MYRVGVRDVEIDNRRRPSRIVLSPLRQVQRYGAPVGEAVPGSTPISVHGETQAPVPVQRHIEIKHRDYGRYLREHKLRHLDLLASPLALRGLVRGRQRTPMPLTPVAVPERGPVALSRAPKSVLDGGSI